MESKQESGGRNTYPHRTREINPSRSVGGVVAKFATSNLLISVSGRKAAQTVVAQLVERLLTAEGDGF